MDLVPARAAAAAKAAIMIHRVTMDFDADDERDVIRIVKAILKMLGRAFGVRVMAVTLASTEEKTNV